MGQNTSFGTSKPARTLAFSAEFCETTHEP
jgi:hypothetical protein